MKHQPMSIDKERIKLPPEQGAWGKVVAIFDLKIMGFMEIKGCKYIDGENGFFLAFPSMKGKDDKYYNVIWTDDKSVEGQAFRRDVEELLSKELDVSSQPVSEGDLPF
jgi:DNA-binding cell septation regulator SpoVG